jgi:hypothetical protein
MYKYVLYYYEKRFCNPFVILATYNTIVLIYLMKS